MGLLEAINGPLQDLWLTRVGGVRPVGTEDYSPEEGARFEVHFEKLRNRVDGNGAVPFEARIEDGGAGIRWLAGDHPRG